MAMREVSLSRVLLALAAMNEQLFHQIMNRGRAYGKILLNRMKARGRLQLVQKDQDMQSGLAEGDARIQQRKNDKTARQQRAVEWRHVPFATLQATMLAKLPLPCHGQVGYVRGSWRVYPYTQANRSNKLRSLLGSYLEMFRYVHGCHTVDTLKYVYYGRNQHGGYEGMSTVGYASHKNKDTPKETVLSTTDMINNIFACSEYVHKHGSPFKFAGKLFDVGEMVVVERDNGRYDGTVLSVNNFDSYAVRISDPNWSGLLNMTDNAGSYAIETFSANMMEEKHDDVPGQRSGARRARVATTIVSV